MVGIVVSYFYDILETRHMFGVRYGTIVTRQRIWCFVSCEELRLGKVQLDRIWEAH